jgi:predicted ATPase/class 3 adenylate cyclase
METLAFLFTDIEGSTALLTRLGDDSYSVALEAHHHIIRSSLAAFGGVEQGTHGDSFFAVFTAPSACVAAALEMQRAIRMHAWPAGEELRVRMGIHTGEASEASTGMVGYEVHRAARIAAVGYGGQVLVSSSTMSLVQDSLPPGVALLDLGPHRLKDLGRPEVIFQLTADDLTEEFPPLRSLDNPQMPSNLPVQLTSFVGRDAEVRDIAAALREHRLVTITGAGGVGKTRLAFHVAAELLAVSPDGAWVAELASVEDGNGMAEVIARSVGAVKRADASLTESILESLRTKRMLVVLDNCEHLIGDVAALVEEVLLRCPDVRVLATSREGLGVVGERVWPLRSLTTPAPTDSTEVLASSAAVQLLVDRATAVVPNFTLSAANAPAIGEICRRLDGIPLAIELAAARMAAMQPKEVAEHLDERFRLLTGGRRRGIERHQTLRAMVDWSYSLLGERERATFERLGVFAGSFGATAAQSVVSDEDIDSFDVLDTLDELVAKSMLVAEPGPEGSTRYLLLETLCQYALERLDAAGIGDTLRRRHAQYYAELIERVAPALNGPEELVWRSRIAAEIDDLRSAVTWALDRDEPDDAEYSMRIIGALMVESVRNHGAGIGAWAERATTHPATGDSPHRNSVLVAAGYGALDRLDSDAALAYLEQIGDTDTDIITLASAAAVRGNLVLSRGDVAEAERTVRTAFEQLGDTKDDQLARTTLCTAPIFAVLNGDVAGAEAMADDVVCAARALGQPSGLAFAHYTRGFVLSYGREDHEEALGSLTESIDLTHAGASDAVYPHALNAIAREHLLIGQGRPALASLKLALAHSYRVGDMGASASAFAYLVWGFGQLGIDEEAALFAGATFSGIFQMVFVDAPVTAMADTVRARMGEARYQEARARGAVMGYDEIVVMAMDSCDRILTDKQ